MKIFRRVEEHRPSLSKPVLTLGNFDGIHLGHRALLDRVMQDAKTGVGQSVVLTFEPHPLKILAPDRAPRLILTPKDKLSLLQSLGLDAVIIQPFDLAFASVEAEEFVRRYLVDRIGVHKIWIGKDLRFGKGRKGRAEDLRRWGEQIGFEVGVFEPVEMDGHRISSSRIRAEIEKGKVYEASKVLGRYHFISGRVAPGLQRGRQLGFPTANIVPQTEVLPLDGIYASVIQVGDQRWPCVTSIGLNPTFGAGPRTIESYIFDFSEELYGRPVKLFFVKRIREEKKFSSPDLLVEQIKRDALAAREILHGVGQTTLADLTR